MIIPEGVKISGNERYMNELCERELNELNAKILRDPQWTNGMNAERFPNGWRTEWTNGRLSRELKELKWIIRNTYYENTSYCIHFMTTKASRRICWHLIEPQSYHLSLLEKINEMNEMNETNWTERNERTEWTQRSWS